PLEFDGYDDVKAGIVSWPMSVIRLTSKNRKSVSALACKILDAWRGYTDEAAYIYANTDGEPHNTITPIARRRGEEYELDLVLRNNITTDECPMGLYHPHAQYHHIKKENIGLIEVMGLAVLPARLKGEIELMKKYILSGCLDENKKGIESHLEWIGEFLPMYADINADNIDGIIKEEIGKVFVKVLECAGVFKYSEEGDKHFVKFARSVGAR
ncbi:MAG: galactose-1-phosphate uridylyltransferase, partial [Ruminococcaceae bacterium]|nr:galactose-1-phosphate uridylyltransferase [Oscillospiraceae bacterium]